MADYFDSPRIEVQKYTTPYLMYMLALRLSAELRRAIEEELKTRGEVV
jgi:hypothetical protein